MAKKQQISGWLLTAYKIGEFLNWTACATWLAVGGMVLLFGTPGFFAAFSSGVGFGALALILRHLRQQ
jgi:hypothetical protein